MCTLHLNIFWKSSSKHNLPDCNILTITVIWIQILLYAWNNINISYSGPRSVLFYFYYFLYKVTELLADNYIHNYLIDTHYYITLVYSRMFILIDILKSLSSYLFSSCLVKCPAVSLYCLDNVELMSLCVFINYPEIH